MRPSPWPMAGILILAVVLGASPLLAAKETGKWKCHDGIDNDGDGLIDHSDPDCQKGGGDATGNDVQLQFAYDFEGTVGVLGMSGVVECGSGYCEILVDPGGSQSFHVDPSLKPIIDATSFHSTPLDADLCYDNDGDGNYDLADVDYVFLRVYDDPSQGWALDVRGYACDMDSSFGSCDAREYRFKFQGTCPASGCDPIPTSSGDDALYDGGSLGAIWSPGPDQKLGVACRCTRSNDPGCPDDTGQPIPGMALVVTALP